MPSLIRLNDVSFPETVNQSKPVLISYGAPKKCPKCPKQKPALEELAEQGLPVYYVDIEQMDSISAGESREDRRVPIHQIWVNGSRLAQHVGLTSADVLETLLFTAEQTLLQNRRRQARAERDLSAVGTFGRSGRD
jgi:thiol-disulfide isomerase/thioredoxin